MINPNIQVESKILNKNQVFYYLCLCNVFSLWWIKNVKLFSLLILLSGSVETDFCVIILSDGNYFIFLDSLQHLIMQILLGSDLIIFMVIYDLWLYYLYQVSMRCQAGCQYSLWEL